jgi:hypothetical protein
MNESIVFDDGLREGIAINESLKIKKIWLKLNLFFSLIFINYLLMMN